MALARQCRHPEGQLATALIGISSIHLLKTFINAGNPTLEQKTMLWQVIIHALFVLSAVALAFIDRLTFHPAAKAE